MPESVDRTHARHSEPETEPAVDPSEVDLLREAARAVLGVEGVLRLEPRLKDILRRMDPSNFRRPEKQKVPDGISVKTFGTITDLTVDLAIRSTSRALPTAAKAQEAIRMVLREGGREPGRIVVNILAVEHG